MGNGNVKELVGGSGIMEMVLQGWYADQEEKRERWLGVVNHFVMEVSIGGLIRIDLEIGM